MGNATNLFEGFQSVSKSEWLVKIEKDLKGKPLADLQFQLEEDITLESFYHPNDFNEFYKPLAGETSWQIGEYIEASNVKIANEQALEALNGGANALLFELRHELSEAEIVQLLAGIELEYIHPNFGQYFPGKNPALLLERFYNFVKSNGKNPQNIAGSLDFDAILDWSNPPFDDLAKAVQFCHQEMPNFRVVEVDARRLHSGVERTSQELAYTLAKGSEYLAQLAERGVHPGVTNQHIQFAIAISTSYFVEIAKIRALKILWLNVLEAYGTTTQSPFIEVHFAPESQDNNSNTNMIRAATQALSAVVGGADRLYILPANAALGEASTSFTRRIARNVQHLLQMESHVDKVSDAGAGSYYIEKLTNILAEKAWAKFQEIEAQGGYLVAG
ncbi:MAG: methylmalonyl-CoA mutase family protein [Saprospiraceae bacterium]|nr:methylmalonyl-CoA mutase family protein [Saprospiraceae bacterium]